MSSLTEQERRYVEDILNMDDGYVLDFTDATFRDFFQSHGINIDAPAFSRNGKSKAKRLRTFWSLSDDATVGKVLDDMLDIYVANHDIAGRTPNERVLSRARAAAARLLGKQPRPVSPTAAFLQQAFPSPHISELPIDAALAPIIDSRYEEALTAFEHGAYLSTVIMCGSILEAVLLGAAQANPADFNRATAAPKNQHGKPKPFHKWTLANFIDVATELELLSPDIDKFSHGLRDFRNYVHPHMQLLTQFTPDEHTAKICLQVLKAALANLTGKRSDHFNDSCSGRFHAVRCDRSFN